MSDGATEGSVLGIKVGTMEGVVDGRLLSSTEGVSDGATEGSVLGIKVGVMDGVVDGRELGSIDGMELGN